MKIADFSVNDRGRIVGISSGDKVYRQRLLAMGLVPGTEFAISRIAPLGDPIELSVKGFALTLRKTEAAILKVERV